MSFKPPSSANALDLVYEAVYPLMAVVDGPLVVAVRVSPFGVVPALDVFEDGTDSCGRGSVRFSVQQFFGGVAKNTYS